MWNSIIKITELFQRGKENGIRRQKNPVYAVKLKDGSNEWYQIFMIFNHINKMHVIFKRFSSKCENLTITKN